MTNPSRTPDGSPVTNVAVVSTGAGAGHPEHVFGTRKPAYWWIFRSKEWVALPLNVFVIEHERGLVLFDTGVSPAVNRTDFWPDRVTKFFMDHIFRFDVGPDDGLADQLERAGYAAGDVVAAVLSHLHFDHAGGIAEIPQADLYASPEAWDHLQGPHPEREGVLRRDIEIPGAAWHLLDFVPVGDNDPLAPFGEACDLFGDGSLTVVPTPGHLAGSVSLLVRRAAAPPVLLIGDLTYSEDLLDADAVAGTGDANELRRSYAKVRALKQAIPDLVVIAGHDQGAAAKLAGEPATSLDRSAIVRDPAFDVVDDVVVRAEPATVFRAIVDEHNGRTEWWAPTRTLELRAGSSYDEVGALVDHTVLIRNRVPLRFTTRTTAVEPGREIRVEYTDGAFTGEGVWRVDADPSGSRLSYRWRTTPAGPLRLVGRVLPVTHSHRSTMAAGFDGLRRYLDGPIDLTSEAADVAEAIDSNRD